jgi:hypothetical protein
LHSRYLIALLMKVAGTATANHLKTHPRAQISQIIRISQLISINTNHSSERKSPAFVFVYKIRKCVFSRCASLRLGALHLNYRLLFNNTMRNATLMAAGKAFLVQQCIGALNPCVLEAIDAVITPSNFIS